MKSDTFKHEKPINPDRLHDEVKAALGDKYISMDTVGGSILVRVSDAATEADNAAIVAIIAAHDPSALSADQTRAKERVDAYKRLTELDVTGIRGKTGKAQIDDIINAIADIQKLLRGSPEPEAPTPKLDSPWGRQ